MQIVKTLFAACFASMALSLSLLAQLPSLDLNTAIFRALTCSTSLKADEGNVLAKKGDWMQATLQPNPIFSIDYDSHNWGGNSNYNSEEAALSVGLAQVFEMGGKRSARSRRGEADYRTSLWDYELAKLDLTDRVTEAFFEAVLAQQKLKLAKKQRQTLGEIMEIITAQVEAEKQSPLQQSRVSLENFSQEILIKKLERECFAAKQRLSLLWQQPCPDFDEVTYCFEEILMPPFPADCTCFERHPSVLRWDSEKEAAMESIRHEIAQKTPDVTVQAGFNRDDTTHAFVGFSFPLPIFNRNQGNIAKAYALADIANVKREEVLRQLIGAAEDTYDHLSSLYSQATLFHDSLFTSSKKIFEQIKEGFLYNKFSYLDVLEAQKNLFDAETEYVHLLTEFQAKRQHFFLLTLSRTAQEEEDAS